MRTHSLIQVWKVFRPFRLGILEDLEVIVFEIPGQKQVLISMIVLYRILRIAGQDDRLYREGSQCLKVTFAPYAIHTLFSLTRPISSNARIVRPFSRRTDLLNDSSRD